MQTNKTFKVPKNQLGFISKSRDGKSVTLKVEQEMTLKVGDVLILRTPKEEVESLLSNGVIDEAKAEERMGKIPDWKLYNVNLLPNNKD